ncbi:MAG: Na+/H+ antiporter subunit E [Ahrensia sp.]|nr:Na+/H+ antiporter subunit E [Ahrensia sp.]
MIGKADLGLTDGERGPIRAIVLAVLLMAMWLLMSGIYKPLVVGLGVFSVILCAFLVRHLGLLSKPTFNEDFALWRALRYAFWLTVEIGKADWAVAKIILSPDRPKNQRLIFVPAEQRTEHGKMLFATSITITPGTVTVETEPDRFLVHALTDEAADKGALAAMGAKVCALEKLG